MDQRFQSRRVILGYGVGLAAGLAFPCPAIAQKRLMPTPQQTEGPFYPERFPEDADNDLVRFGGPGEPEGILTKVSGRVTDTRGQPLAGARVEIWQCDAHGLYHHVSDDDAEGTRDEEFQGFGRVVTGDDGRYEFRTIRPVEYGARTPHIHYKVEARGHELLVTQLYVEGEARNASDGVLQRIKNAEARASIIRPFESDGSGQAVTFDLVLV